MFIDWFDDVETEEADDMESGFFTESECCGYVRTRDIFDAIAEYERSNEWN